MSRASGKPACVVVLAFAVAVLATAAPLHAQYDYLLRYVDGSDAARLVDSVRELQDKRVTRGTTQVLARCRVLEADAESDTRVAAFAKTVPAERWAGVQGVVRVAYARPLQRRSPPDDPFYVEQWNLQRIDAVGAWDYTTGGTTVTGERIVIGVIELDGVDVRHPDLRGNFYVNPGERPGNRIDDDGNGYVDDVSGVNFDEPQSNAFEPHPHGTHVAALLGARGQDGSQAAGLNWDARLLPFQISNSVDWVLALDYLTDLRTRYNASAGRDGAYVVVANCSFGADDVDCGDVDYREVDAAIERAGRAGILTAGATSNDIGDVDRRPSTPSSCGSPFLVTVTAADQSDGLVPNAGSSASRVDLAAPGSTFRSVDYVSPSGSRQTTFAGTSGATPQVAGVIALMYAAACEALIAQSIAEPAAVALELRARILSAVDPVPELEGRVASGGRLNARRAVEAAALGPDCASEAIVVATSPALTPPPVIADAGVRLTLSEVISEAWHLYRYRVDEGSPQEARDLARAAPAIRLATLDYHLRRSDTQIGPGLGDAQDLSAVSGSALALPLRSSPLRATASLLDFGYADISEQTLARRNELVRGLGAHGLALASGVAAVMGSQEASAFDAESFNAYAGYRLSDWLTAAALAAGVDAVSGIPDFAIAGGGFGTALWLPDETDAPEAETFVAQIIDSLAAARIVTVLPRSLRAPVVTASNAALWPSSAIAATAPPAIGGPVDLDRGGSCQAEGQAVTVGALTGAATVLAELECRTDGGFPARDIAEALRRSSGGDMGRLDVLGAARILLEDCENADAVGVALVYPNLVRRGAPTRLLYRSPEASAILVVDAAGHRVGELPALATDHGTGSLQLETDDLATGIYFLSLRDREGGVGVLVVRD